MSSLNVSQLTAKMIASVKETTSDGWPAVEQYARAELKILAQSLVQIVELRANGNVSKAEARSLFRQHKNTAVAVFASIAGMTLLLAEQTVNNALKVVKDAVNAAAGFIFI